MPKIKELLKNKKVVAGLVIVLIGGYYLYSRNSTATAATQYMLGSVERGTLTVSVTGSGQVSSLSQIDVKPEVSGRVLSIPVHAGQQITSGTILAQLDSKDAYKNVRDASLSLQSAQLSLQKLKQSADQLTLTQAQDNLVSARDNVAKLELQQKIEYQKAQQDMVKAATDMQKSVEDEFNAVADSFLDYPSIMAGLYDMVNGTSIGDSEPTAVGRGQLNSSALLNSLTLDTDRAKLQVYINSAQDDYNAARVLYDKNFSDYKTVNIISATSSIESLAAKTLATAKAISQAVKSESNVLDAYADFQTQQNKSVYSKIKTFQTSIGGYVSQANSHVSDIYSAINALHTSRTNFTSAQNSLTQMEHNNPLDLAAAEATVNERQASLDKTIAGADTLDVQSSELSVRQRQAALYDASQELAKYAVRSPISGVVAKVSAVVGDTAGSGGAVATIITPQKIAELSLNEVDAAKIKVGQKAILTFDAVEDLSITGQVAEVDTVGTVSQGVVSYAVKIIFDTQDDRVKSGMSVSATIITSVAQDVLMVPSGAVKSGASGSYVEMFDGQKYQSGQTVTSASAPAQHAVETGISNDTSVIITSGVKEGDVVVVRSVQSTTAKATTQSAASLFSTGGNRGFTGGTAVRTQTR